MSLSEPSVELPVVPKPGLGGNLRRVVGFKLCLLDFIIAVGRKVGGFCGLLSLGWLYFRLLALGDSLAQIYPSAPDPALRHTLWVALFLIMAQGWDIPADRLAELWTRLHARFPERRGEPPEARSGARLRPFDRPRRALVEPTVRVLGRFMDLCVAIANKVGAFAVFCYLIDLGLQFGLEGATVRELYPTAADPTLSFLADLCVYVVVLGWWATPFEQISIFWRRLRGDTAA